MFEHVLGIVMLVIALQFLKAYFPIVSTFDGNVISVAFWTECIAKSPIVLTELGSFTLFTPIYEPKNNPAGNTFASVPLTSKPLADATLEVTGSLVPYLPQASELSTMFASDKSRSVKATLSLKTPHILRIVYKSAPLRLPVILTFAVVNKASPATVAKEPGVAIFHTV